MLAIEDSHRASSKLEPDGARPGRPIGSDENDRGMGHAGQAAGSGQHVVLDYLERLIPVAVVGASESDLVDMIRLLVVDEHPVIGEGIRAILNDEPDFWVETVTDVDAANAALDARHHDIVICEIRLTGTQRWAGSPATATGGRLGLHHVQRALRSQLLRRGG